MGTGNGISKKVRSLLLSFLLAWAALPAFAVSEKQPLKSVHPAAGLHAHPKVPHAGPQGPFNSPKLIPARGKAAAPALPRALLVPEEGAPEQPGSLRDGLESKAGEIRKAGASGRPADLDQALHKLYDERGPDVLASERLSFTAGQIARVRETEKAVESAVRELASSLLPGGGFEVASRGSTARLTHASQSADFDVKVRVRGENLGEDFDAFIDRHQDVIKDRLVEAARSKAEALYPGQVKEVAIRGPVQLKDELTHKENKGVYLFPVKVYGAESVLLLDVDVTFTDRERFASPYPEYFAAQMEQVGRLGGPALQERVLSDIRLAKKLFKTALHQEGFKPFYKAYHGGPGGVGVEQLIMQSGKVSDEDKGRTILEPGSFDKFIARVLKTAYDERGDFRGIEPSRRLWTVHHPFFAPFNFLELLSDLSWERLASAAKKYAAAKAAGRPITLAALSPETAPAVPAPQAEPLPEAADISRVTLDLLKQFMPTGPPPEARGDAFLYAEGAKILPAELEEAWKSEGPKPFKTARDGWTERGTYFIRDGKGFVKMPDDGGPKRKPLRVPDFMVQGLLPDSLVEVALSRAPVKDRQGKGKTEGTRVDSLRAIGVYPVDMIVGRVRRSGTGLALDTLFTEDGARKALYAPLALQGGAPVEDGDIVQAFVKPVRGGYAAVPLIHMGRKITPEVAARDISLRAGARGYFERAIIRQAEETAKTMDPAAEFKKISDAGARTEDLRSLPFITIDPPGAADLDDAYYVEKHADESFTWYLATADVPRYVKPGTPAFKAAVRTANTYYSIDKDGVPAYPMNHPVVSQAVASLLSGKDSLAVVTKMSFGPGGEFLIDKTDVFLGLVKVQGRYTYDQVTDLWKGKPGHGIEHLEQVALARELAGRLHEQDKARGKLNFSFSQVAHHKSADGAWVTETVEEDPLVRESHRLIEELKVYGNRALVTRLERMSGEYKVPHIRRVHPFQEELNKKLRAQLNEIGLVWGEAQSLADFLSELNARADVAAEVKEVVQKLALRTRSRAAYALEDEEGHEGLALDAGLYDHPSAPIRRFSDMYNLTVLQSVLEGSDPRKAHDAVLADLKSLGFESLFEYMAHLNARQQASKRMKYEMDDFMAVYELAKPEYRGKTFPGVVTFLVERGENAIATIQLQGIPGALKISGEKAKGLALLSEVSVTVHGADLSQLKVDVDVKVLSKPKN